MVGIRLELQDGITGFSPFAKGASEGKNFNLQAWAGIILDD